MKLTFLMLAAYCFMAIFSTLDSKPKNDFISIVADCSKQVQFGLSGCTCVEKGHKVMAINTTPHQPDCKPNKFREQCRRLTYSVLAIFVDDHSA